MAIPNSEHQHIKLGTFPVSSASVKLVVNQPTLGDLISQCDPKAHIPAQDAEWDTLRSVGNELL
jgi:hypothetical protein